MVFLTLVGLSGVSRAAQPTPNPRDTLVYKDGDNVQGRLVEQTATTIVFAAGRFGELRVPVAEAVVIKGVKPPAAPAVAAGPVAPAPAPPAAATKAAKSAAVAAAERRDEERMTAWDRFSPSVLTARVRGFFGPWKGRISFSSEVVTDVAKRNNSAYEAFARRKWTADELQLNARFDYNETNDLTTTDLLKAWGQWRRDFSKVFFLHYRPTGEWNRASRLRGLPNDYVLLQQELGAGYQVVTLPSRKLRVGVSQNRFDTWNSSLMPDHSTRGLQSLFEETEITLPWRMTIAQRGVWYPVSGQEDGWENRFDLNKKLTETLSTSLRHEIRRSNPDGSAPDYTKLKLLFGLDF